MQSLTDIQHRFDAVGYVAEPGLSAALLLLAQLQRPLLIEGEAGVGKTEVAKALALASERPLIRLQCYEGLDVNTAVYEWNYQRQLLAIKIHETKGHSPEDEERHIFSEQYLLQRPLLQAIRMEHPPVLLVDEIDRADEEFEAYLLELLSDFQVSVPEIGTLKAISLPYVVLTSNATRELSDALRRRCLYYYMDFPNFEKELSIVTKRLPKISSELARQVVDFVQSLRGLDLRKKPGIAETLDWAGALLGMDLKHLNQNPDELMPTLVCLLKTREDRAAVTAEVVRQLAAKSA
jgi:MoxR-like ATPase